LRSVPRLDRARGAKLETIEGLPPNLLEPPPGCRFAPRCPARRDACVAALPELEEVAPHHYSACIRAKEMAQVGADGLGLQQAGQALAVAKDIDRSDPLLRVHDLRTYFEVGAGMHIFRNTRFEVRAVDGLTFEVFRGETLGLVGESGCGKTTVGRTLLRLEQATGGEIVFNGANVTRVTAQRLKDYRRKVQVIFQDPYSSLNPRMTVGEIIAEPMLVYRLVPDRRAARARVLELLTQVGLFEYMAERYPHELSGGQRQRVGIARALAMQPEFIVCDEPVSALDVSIQAQIINLLEDLQRKFQLTFLFIAHDLAVVRHISDRVIVMYLGKTMEVADRDALYADPLHPYTRALLDAVPIPDPELEAKREYRVLSGEVPSPLSPPRGCVFHTRCPMASEECKIKIPELREIKPRHFAACIKI
jgi:peptide/nickel transport system ATP-binding protein